MMNKGILVLDMPKNCLNCPLASWATCRITKKCHTGYFRPDYCPIKVLSEECAKTPTPNHPIPIDTQQYISELERKVKEKDWIPCSERYPDTDDYILLSFENFSVPLVGRYEEDAEGGAFYIGDDSESCVSQDIIVNGWMPLMKCYREKGDEENE